MTALLGCAEETTKWLEGVGRRAKRNLWGCLLKSSVPCRAQESLRAPRFPPRSLEGERSCCAMNVSRSNIPRPRNGKFSSFRLAVRELLFMSKLRESGNSSVQALLDLTSCWSLAIFAPSLIESLAQYIVRRTRADPSLRYSLP